MSASARAPRTPAPPLRVLHLRNSDVLGGPERLLLDQVERARRDPGLAVTVTSFGREGSPHAFLDEARARGLDARLVPQAGSYDRRLTARVRALLAAVAPAVVVGHDYKANLLLRRTAVKQGLPWVAVVHGYTGENLKVRLFERLDRRGLRRAAAVVVVAEEGREQALRAGVPAERVHLIRNGIDVDRVRAAAREGRARVRGALGLAPEHVALLALGRLSPEKGQRLLLEAWRQLPRHGVPATLASRLRLVLVGDGAERAGLEALAQGDARVLFAGWRADPHACLGAADVFALPSLREGLPLALLEAMAVGLPIVATSVGGVPEALEHGRVGAVVAPGDVPGLAAALADALVASAGGRGEVQAAVERVRERFGSAAQAEALAALYRAVAR